MTIATLPIEDAPRFQKDTRGFATRAVQAGAPHDPVTGAVIAPVTPPPAITFWYLFGDANKLFRSHFQLHSLKPALEAQLVSTNTLVVLIPIGITSNMPSPL